MESNTQPIFPSVALFQVGDVMHLNKRQFAGAGAVPFVNEDIIGVVKRINSASVVVKFEAIYGQEEVCLRFTKGKVDVLRNNTHGFTCRTMTRFVPKTKTTNICKHCKYNKKYCQCE
jgi:hypothetical protein